MNNEILKKYNINFYKRATGKSIEIKDVVSSYLYIWKQIDDINDFLHDIDLCLKGNIESVEDTDYSDGLLNLYGQLTHNELIISDKTGLHWRAIPLFEFKELLLSWKEFLES